VALLTITAIAPLLGWQARNAVLADYGGLSATVDVNGRAIQSGARGRQRNGSTIRGASIHCSVSGRT
jgi:hypothetical protein